LLISTDAIGERARQHTAAVDAAKRASVKHIVYTSMPKPETSDVSFAPDHLATEQAIKASGIGYTLLRNSWYAENLIGAITPALASGKWYSASGDGPTAHVSREDCAQAAAAALLSSDTASHTYNITGTELLSVTEIAAMASDITGKAIEVVHVDDAAYAAGLAHAGLPPAIIPMIGSFEVSARNGGFEIKTDDVEKLTGNKPQAVRAFLEANRAAFG
jgi:NAD(P)H dehydrogenase (quinone)